MKKKDRKKGTPGSGGDAQTRSGEVSVPGTASIEVFSSPRKVGTDGATLRWKLEEGKDDKEWLCSFRITVETK
ncbi:MAG: hypothetical protein FJ109_13125 [Deltaproteobacteria bacterium]|nr:hypothetical protein [Deltaproteobacteria bacterium]